MSGSINGKRQSVAKLLEDLRDWRNSCDYDSDFEIDPAKVKIAIQRSEKVIGILKG